MKKLNILLTVAILISGVNLFAQDDLKKPNDIGVAEYDNFKNNSFQVYEDSKNVLNDAKVLDANISAYADNLSNVSKSTIKDDLQALYDLSKKLPNITENIAKLSGQSDDLISNAKNVKPKTKTVTAIKNTKKSVEALNEAKKNMDETQNIITKNTTILQKAGGDE